MQRACILIVVTALLATTTLLTAQVPDSVPLPLLHPPQTVVYMAVDGADSGSGDSLDPVATFAVALDRLATWSTGKTGELHAEIVLREGTYAQALIQPWGRYQLAGRRLNVSVRGMGAVVLDGQGLPISAGQGMVHLLGSHIRVSNLNVAYSPANGVRFGLDANGNVANPHDVLVEDVTVSQTSGHGILLGINPIKNADPFNLHPPGERYAVRRCTVLEAVNFNQPLPQWGSAIKFHNVRFGLAELCHVHDNSGEGIDVDLGEQIIIRANTLHDNYANIYIDKGTGIRIERNHIHNAYRQVPGILLGIEAFTGLITAHFVKDIAIHNNIILNTATGISIWQGIYSALQQGTFSGIDIRHNTILGQRAQKAAIGFSYSTFLGSPVPNVAFSQIRIAGNILSAHPDSLNNGRLLTAPLTPQPGLTSSHNLWNLPPGPGFNTVTDQSRPSLPDWADPADTLSFLPRSGNPAFIFAVPAEPDIPIDLLGLPRDQALTNAGALEKSLFLQIPDDQDTGERIASAYPNPVHDHCTIIVPGKIFSGIIHDPEGRTLQIIPESQGSVQLSTSHLPRGIHFVQIRCTDGHMELLSFSKH